MKHHPKQHQIEAFKQALEDAQEACPEFTPAHMRFLALRRDRFLESLRAKTCA